MTFKVRTPRILAALAGLVLLPPAVGRAADLGLPRAFTCGEARVDIVAGPDEARARLGGRWMTFRPAVAASGAKYEAPGVPDRWVWTKGEEVTVSLPETGEVACAPAAPALNGFSAGGSEPGWRLTMQDGNAELTPQDGAAIRDTPTAAEAIPGGRRIGFASATAEVADSLCRDTATGMPYPHAVTVTTAGTIYKGCGGDPRALLAGLMWKVTEIGGQPVPADVTPTIGFADDGTASGMSGCNRFTGRYELTGEGLAFGPLAMTRMACPEPQSATERAMGTALATITRFDMAEDGRLILLAGEKPAVTART